MGRSALGSTNPKEIASSGPLNKKIIILPPPTVRMLKLYFVIKCFVCCFAIVFSECFAGCYLVPPPPSHVAIALRIGINSIERCVVNFPNCLDSEYYFVTCKRRQCVLVDQLSIPAAGPRVVQISSCLHALPMHWWEYSNRGAMLRIFLTQSGGIETNCTY